MFYRTAFVKLSYMLHIHYHFYLCTPTSCAASEYGLAPEKCDWYAKQLNMIYNQWNRWKLVSASRLTGLIVVFRDFYKYF